jgi:hypothetical protein
MAKAEAVQFADIRQRQMEAFEDLRPSDSVKGAKYLGDLVRAAISAGWLSDYPDPAAVADMLPLEVRRLAEAVAAKFVELTTIPKN